ncbi:MAG: roadblock/LC7 domain-containing protein [Candidatus Sericytochromatia bacterium]
MLNPILSNLSLTMEQIKKAEESLHSYSHEDMLVLLVENSGQVIATNGRNTKKYDLAIISALSVAAFESTKGLAKAMGQEFNHVENRGESSNLYITRLNDHTVLVIDYPANIPSFEIETVTKNLKDSVNELSKEWEIVEKGHEKGKGPLKSSSLDGDIDDMFNHLS